MSNRIEDRAPTELGMTWNNFSEDAQRVLGNILDEMTIPDLYGDKPNTARLLVENISNVLEKINNYGARSKKLGGRVSPNTIATALFKEAYEVKTFGRQPELAHHLKLLGATVRGLAKKPSETKYESY